MEAIFDYITYFFQTFIIFNINAFYAICYFLKNNILAGVVLFAIGYIVYEDCKAATMDFVEDDRRIM